MPLFQLLPICQLLLPERMRLAAWLLRQSPLRQLLLLNQMGTFPLPETRILPPMLPMVIMAQPRPNQQRMQRSRLLAPRQRLLRQRLRRRL
ncbi:hypothetical protein N008_01130 [Hymenobacter sp. APR13]|nr:hypothetical protein N008_01130 [Hymenobacter sp. APR13]